jgi:D-glycero-alpha-D-manno-heptose-7-phosphate kinase
MFISKTPLRISLFSGGDMESFYKHDDGYCLSCTIDKYITITVNRSQHQNIKIAQAHFSEAENGERPDDIKNALVRETLKGLGVSNNVTISAVSDIDAYGSGLGSSSAFTVGLIAALYSSQGDNSYSKWDLAEDACGIEIGQCHHPIGKQDQYAAALGGLNLLKFGANGEVTQTCSREAFYGLRKLHKRLLLVHSGLNRNANDILKTQNENISLGKGGWSFSHLKANAVRAVEAFRHLEQRNYDFIGYMMHEAWLDKKEVAVGISNPAIDEIYDKARRHGALGGKLIGAGGGGFFIFYADEEFHHDIKNALSPLKFYDFKFVEEGCRVVKI